MANDKFINQFPYTDFHEMNLDWLIQKTKQLQAEMIEVQKVIHDIEILTEEQIIAMIEAAIANNNNQLYAKMTKLYEDITAEYQSYISNQINMLTVYVDNQDVHYDLLAQGYADQAYNNAKAYVDAEVLDYTMMINPVTGEYEDVRNVVTDIVTYFHTEDALTAGEYDTLELTAEDYDNYEITAYDYDFNGKTILMP